MGLEKLPSKLYRRGYDVSVSSISGDTLRQERSSSEPRIKCRYVVVLMGFVAEFYYYAHRIVVGVSIVAMVNNSAISTEEDFKSESCINLISNTSDDEFSFKEKEGEFNWTPELQGYIIGSSFICFMITTSPAAIVTELFGCKKVLFWSFFLASLFTFLSPLAAWWNVYLLIIVQSLRGVAQAGVIPAESIMIANWCPKSESGFSFTFILSGSCLGAALGSYFSGLLCESSLLGGWPLTYFVFGGTGIVASLWLGFCMYDNPSVHPTISESEFKYITDQQEGTLTQKRPKTPWFNLFTSVPVYALAFAYFGQMWAVTHFLSVQPTFLGTILHYSIEKTGLFSALPFLLQFIASVGGGWLSDFFTNKNYMTIDTARKFCNFMSCFGYSACLLGIYFSGCNRSISIVFGIVGLAFTGFGFAGCWVTSPDMSPTFAGSVNAIACTIGYTANFLMPVTAGYITNEMQTIEEWNKIFFISIGLVMSSGVVFAVFGSAKVQPWNNVQKDVTEMTEEKTRF